MMSAGKKVCREGSNQSNQSAKKVKMSIKRQLADKITCRKAVCKEGLLPKRQSTEVAV